MLGNVWWPLQPSRDNSSRYLQRFPSSSRSEVSEDSFEKSICILTHDYKDISFLRYLVALPLLCLCTGNGGLSSRLLFLGQKDERLLIISAGRRDGAHCRKTVRRCEFYEPRSRWHLRSVLQSCRPCRPGFLE